MSAREMESCPELSKLSTFLPLFFCNYPLHRSPEVRHLALDDIPDKLVVDSQIAVDELITRPGHLPSLDLRV